MTFLQLLICALAVFRLSEMFVIDDGMFDIFINIRGWFNKAPMDSKGLRRTIANGLTCVHCVGIWFSILLSAILFHSSIMDFIVSFLAIAGLQSLMANNLGRK